MKLTIFLVLLSVMSVFAGKTYSQTKGLTLDLKNSSVKEVLQNIENQSEFYFMYSEKLVDVKREVSVNVRDKKINEVLDGLFAGTDVSYKVRDRFILLTTPEVSGSEIMVQQQVTISGKVTDLSGQSLPGVTVAVKGKAQGTITDGNGVYSLSNVSPDAVLVFSFVGMKTQEIPISGKSSINVTMEEETIGIEEVVAIGYGSKKKEDIIGSVAVVDMKGVNSVVTHSVLNALQGQASGVNVITCGVPGSTSQIYVRGLTSFGDNKPLVLVDGVPGDLDNVNTTDVESIQVLKDAGAAAIYGTRGSNGVIIVTTKKGGQGDPVVTYEGYCGFTNNLGKNPYNLVNSEEYMNLVLTATPTSLLFKGGMPDYSFRGPLDAGPAMVGDSRIDPANYNLDLDNPEKRYLIFKVNKKGTDWYSEMYKPALSTNHNVSVTGGTQKVNYLLSLGYLDQQGTLLETYFKRYSTRLKLECKVNKNFRIGQNLYYYYRDQNTPGAFDSESMAYGMLPIIPVNDIMGNLAGTYAGIELGSYVNPVGTRKRTLSDRDHSWILTGSVFAEVDFLKYFKARTNIGAFIGNYYSINFSPKVYDNAESAVRNSLSESSSYSSKKIWTNTLDFTKSFGKHTLNVLGGTEFILDRGRSLTGGSSVFYSEDFSFCILGNGSETVTNSSSGSESALFSVFSRLDYSYDQKYLISGTIRRDGSSRFGSGKKYGNFPSVSLGWRISRESFMKQITWLDDLKIRMSYGILGSETNVNPDNAYNLYTSSNKSSYYNITGSYNTITQGFHQSRLGNPNTGWESDVVANAGFDAILFKNSLDISLEVYHKSIEGLLFTAGLPALVGGATYPTVNVGDVKNAGIDFSSTYHGTIKSKVKYHIGANITAYKNEIVNIPDPGWFSSGSYVRNEVGHPISSFFGYKVLGIFNNPDEVAAAPTQSAAAAGSFRYQDTKDDKVISADDRVFLGSPHPDFTYGINVRFEYKGFDLSAIFFGSQGNEIVNATKSDTHFFGAYVGNKSKDMLNAWTPENTNTMQPKVSLGSNFSTSSFSSWFVEDGSYLKCRSIRLGYTFNPTSFVGRIGGKNLRLYVEGKNLFTITNYSGLDPEVGSSDSAAFGIDNGRYPGTEKNFILGLNISF